MAMVMENQQPLARMPPVVPAPPLPPPPPPPLPQATYRHRCKVCKKGFTCGRALGGHMRAHGVTDDGLSAAADDDSGPSGRAGDDSSEARSASAAVATKRMYSLRTSAGRLRNCRVCENCGREFTSWKALVDHGRCNQDREEDEGDFNISDADIDGEDGEDVTLAAGWSKGKRTRRAKVIVEHLPPATSREEEDLANCLVMLASSSGAHAVVDVHRQSSYAPVSQDEEETNRFLVPQPISVRPPTPPTVPQLKLLAPPQVMTSHVSTTQRGLFECKACKKVFTSHQALGGHRASHKKVKGCFAAKLDSNRNDSPQPTAASSNDNIKVVVEAIPAFISTESNGANGSGEGNMMSAPAVAVATAAAEMTFMQVDEAGTPSSTVPPFKKKGKVHECSICHRVFMSGQALGGHKRCHWLTTGGGDPTAAVDKIQPFVTKDQVMHAMCQQLTLGRPIFDDQFLDLNVPTNPLAADPGATKQAAELNDSMLSLNAPASLYMMHSWAEHSYASNMNNTATSGHYDVPEATPTEDETDSSTSAKRAKMSDLKDMNMSGETSPWLQVGIALPSETNEKTAPA